MTTSNLPEGRNRAFFGSIGDSINNALRQVTDVTTNIVTLATSLIDAGTLALAKNPPQKAEWGDAKIGELYLHESFLFELGSLLMRKESAWLSGLAQSAIKKAQSDVLNRLSVAAEAFVNSDDADPGLVYALRVQRNGNVVMKAERGFGFQVISLDQLAGSGSFQHLRATGGAIPGTGLGKLSVRPEIPHNNQLGEEDYAWARALCDCGSCPQEKHAQCDAPYKGVRS